MRPRERRAGRAPNEQARDSRLATEAVEKEARDQIVRRAKQAAADPYRLDATAEQIKAERRARETGTAVVALAQDQRPVPPKNPAEQRFLRIVADIKRRDGLETDPEGDTKAMIAASQEFPAEAEAWRLSCPRVGFEPTPDVALTLEARGYESLKTGRLVDEDDLPGGAQSQIVKLADEYRESQWHRFGRMMSRTTAIKLLKKQRPEIVSRTTAAPPPVQQPPAVVQFDALVESLRAADPKLTYSGAIVEAAKRNPDLAARRNDALRTLASA